MIEFKRIEMRSGTLLFQQYVHKTLNSVSTCCPKSLKFTNQVFYRPINLILNTFEKLWKIFVIYSHGINQR